jgi:hypothetical protein
MPLQLRLAARIAAMPLLGALALVSAVRDTAVAARVRDDEAAADRAVAVSLDRLDPESLAVVLDWKYGH